MAVSAKYLGYEENYRIRIILIHCLRRVNFYNETFEQIIDRLIKNEVSRHRVKVVENSIFKRVLRKCDLLTTRELIVAVKELLNCSDKTSRTVSSQ